MKAIVVQEKKIAKVAEKDIPVPEKDEVLVKVVAVALNPTDWKHVEFIAEPGVIVGCDFAGVVTKVGDDVKDLHVGDHVGGFSHGSRYQHTGAFAEYLVNPADITFKRPQNLTFAEAATFGVGAMTAAAGLFQKLGLPTPAKPSTTGEWFLVWSGASSVGQFAIQLAKLAGFKVVATASPKNHEYLKTLGADELFDYRDADVSAKIKAVTGDSLAYGIDCNSDADSHAKSEAAIGAKGGKIITILGKPQNQSRSDVTFVPELLYSATGKELKYGPFNYPAAPQDREFIRDFIRAEMNELMASGKLKPNKIKAMQGGLEKIQEGMDYMKAGQASLEKLTYHIQDA